MDDLALEGVHRAQRHGVTLRAGIGHGLGRQLLEPVLVLRTETADVQHQPGAIAGAGLHRQARSEEHTSELQSRGHLVCRLLLEKKKTHEPWRLTALRTARCVSL